MLGNYDQGEASKLGIPPDVGMTTLSLLSFRPMGSSLERQTFGQWVCWKANRAWDPSPLAQDDSLVVHSAERAIAVPHLLAAWNNPG
jgi:hypothetical protein